MLTQNPGDDKDEDLRSFSARIKSGEKIETIIPAIVEKLKINEDRSWMVDVLHKHNEWKEVEDTFKILKDISHDLKEMQDKKSTDLATAVKKIAGEKDDKNVEIKEGKKAGLIKNSRKAGQLLKDLVITTENEADALLLICLLKARSQYMEIQDAKKPFDAALKERISETTREKIFKPINDGLEELVNRKGERYEQLRAKIPLTLIPADPDAEYNKAMADVNANSPLDVRYFFIANFYPSECKKIQTELKILDENKNSAERYTRLVELQEQYSDLENKKNQIRRSDEKPGNFNAATNRHHSVADLQKELKKTEEEIHELKKISVESKDTSVDSKNISVDSKDIPQYNYELAKKYLQETDETKKLANAWKQYTARSSPVRGKKKVARWKDRLEGFPKPVKAIGSGIKSNLSSAFSRLQPITSPVANFLHDSTFLGSTIDLVHSGMDYLGVTTGAQYFYENVTASIPEEGVDQGAAKAVAILRAKYNAKKQEEINLKLQIKTRMREELQLSAYTATEPDNKISQKIYKARLEKAFDDTFYVHEGYIKNNAEPDNPIQTNRDNWERYFLGWPTYQKKPHLTISKALYVIDCIMYLGGWLIIPVKNSLKFLFEYSLKYADTTLENAIDQAEKSGETHYLYSGLRLIVWPLWFLARGTFSPLKNISEAAKNGAAFGEKIGNQVGSKWIGHLVGIFSAAFLMLPSLLGLGAITTAIAAAPFILITLVGFVSTTAAVTLAGFLAGLTLTIAALPVLGFLTSSPVGALLGMQATSGLSALVTAVNLTKLTAKLTSACVFAYEFMKEKITTVASYVGYFAVGWIGELYEGAKRRFHGEAAHAHVDTSTNIPQTAIADSKAYPSPSSYVNSSMRNMIDSKSNNSMQVSKNSQPTQIRPLAEGLERTTGKNPAASKVNDDEHEVNRNSSSILPANDNVFSATRSFGYQS